MFPGDKKESVEDTREIFERLKTSVFDINRESSLQKGQSIAGYRIVCPLNLGGLGELYLAVNHLNRKVYALKLLPPLLPALDPDFHARFTESAEILKKHHIHPGIIYTQEAGVENNCYYIVTDYIESLKGKTFTLRDRIERKVRLPRDKIKKIAMQLCGALEYAHHNVEAPLIHSNLKPSNILFDKKNNPVLTDFKELYIIGYHYFIDIVKDAIHCNAPLPENMENSTASGRLLNISKSLRRVMSITQQSIFHKRRRYGLRGILKSFYGILKIKKFKTLSPYEFIHNETNKILNYSPVMESYDYMSPEQKAGEAPTERSNIYSFGLILYNLLTGVKISGNWNLPSNFGCARSWNPIIFKCLQFSPEERYQSFSELRDAIERIDEKRSLFYPAIVTAGIMLITALLLVLSFNFMDIDKESYFIRFKKGIRSIFDPVLKNDTSISTVETGFKIEPKNTDIYFRFEDGTEKHVLVPGNKTKILLEPGHYDIRISRKGYRTLETELIVNLSNRDFSMKLRPEINMEVRKYEYKKDEKIPSEGYAWIIPDSMIELVPVSPGAFVMGSEEMKDKKKVSLEKPFWIGRAEITQRQFEGIMWINPSSFKGDDMLPVDSVSWSQAMEFCRRLSIREKTAGRIPAGYVYRLPLEAEWEYCCRAGTSSVYFFGDDPLPADEFMWYQKNSEREPHRIGSLRSNSWGIYDTLGNVAEWCLDSYGKENPVLVLRDGVKKQPAEYILRGGSFQSLSESISSGKREKTDSPDFLKADTGFRIVLAPEVPAVKYQDSR